MTVGDALGNSGAGWTIEHDGKVFRARLVTQKVKDAFATWMSQRVIRQFLAAQQADGGAYQEAVGIVADRIALGAYDFHGPVAQRAVQTAEGVFRLACLVFDVEEEDGEGRRKPRRPVTDLEMTGLLTERGADVNTVMRLVFARSFPRATTLPESNGESSGSEQGEGDDPNPQGPAGASSGRPTPGASSTPASSTSPSS